MLPNDELPVGTKVRVGSLFGVVVKCEVKPAHPFGFVSVHTIRFNQRKVHKFGQAYKMVDVKPVTRTANYSFIQLAQ